MHRRVARARGAGVILSIFSPVIAAHAATLNYGVDAGVGETDNVTLAHDDKISQTIAVTDFDLDFTQKSQRLDVDARGNFSYLDYLQKAYRNELLGRFDGKAEVALVPQRLTWVVQEDFGQAAINPFTPNTPTNLESINTFATGPDLHLRVGGANFIDFNARATRTQYETSPYTNTRFTGSMAWGLNLSALSSASLNGDTERVLFENTTLNADFERSHLFARYALQGARTDLSADLGATGVTADGNTSTGAFAKFKLSRKISPSAHLAFTLGRDIIDSGTSFSTLQAGATGVIGTAPATNTSQNYTSNYGAVDWGYQRNRTTLGVSGRWERDNYSSLSTLDRTLTTAEMRAQRELTRAFTLRVTGQFYKSNYGNATVIGANGSPDNMTSLITAALVWRHGRALEVTLACEHTSYTTSPNDHANLATVPNDTSYRENRVFLTVGYRPLSAAPVGQEVPDS